MAQHLTKSLKGFFPFKLATTSYIYPDRIVPNVAMLAPFLDEIELVLFESDGLDNYPDQAELESLTDLSHSQGVRYHVHLPVDIYLGERAEAIRSHGVSTVKKVIDRTLRLDPSLYTLHFDLRDKNGREEADIEAWRSRIIRSAREMTEWGIGPERISVETLSYPFEWIEDIVREFRFSVCLDIGHMLIYQQDIPRYFENYLSQTSVIHLHGVENGVDHLGIDRLNDRMIDTVLSSLKNFTGILSIEVFSFGDLKKSLEVLEQRWKKE